MILRLRKASDELADREALSRHQALHDALSGLPNRHNFVERLQESLDGLVQTRNNGRVVVAYVDVDRFKDVNDTMGHQAGDALIMAVAARLQRVLAPNDFLARFGGDEFAVVCRTADGDAGQALADRLRGAFAEAFDVYGQHVRMTASVGLAMAPEHGLSPQELMRHADIALYQGKNNGRDRAMFFCAEMAAEVEQRREIEIDLHAAIEAKSLKLFYQPLIGCAGGRITGVEALLRWKHPTKGDIAPSIFVPIAEEAGLMPALGAFVLERAFQEATRWPTLEVAINLSPVQFRHVDLVELLEKFVAQYQVDPRRIVLEVTEGVMMESTDRNRQILEAIRALGFKIALDDFGTGYSSLRYLCDFRFDKIKIDRAFVTGIHERKRSMTIIQSVVTLGRGLGMDIVAEGVETETEASVMRLVGVTELQGFYFSQAVPADEIEDLAAAFGRKEAEPADPLAALKTQRRG
jgi:diguanylate cyclase (GGDEF)-like protein